MQKTNIPAAIAQEVLDSATNAAQKGLSQFFTLPALAARLAAALPVVRPGLVDLNCGRGDLLQASMRTNGRTSLYMADTQWLLGSDIHNAPKVPGRGRIQFTQADLTLLYPLLVEVGWRADCFVLNPPWRLFWHRARLAALADSTCGPVRRAFAAVEPGTPKDTIDSTIATLLIALDRGTDAGEGYLIANHQTLERLIFAPGAPYADLAQVCWARLVIPGNPMTGITGCQWQEDEVFTTGVIYFAREHPHGPRPLVTWPAWATPSADAPLDEARYPVPNRTFRHGADLRDTYAPCAQTVPRWAVVKEQILELNGRKPKVPWNLWLAGGVVRTGLSSFEEASRKLDKLAAARLHALNGKAPMQLVLQRADRDEVLDVAERGGWRVQPELLAAVRAAVAQYHASRAPLYPLSDIQRLGYTDEEDFLLCQKDLLSPASRVPVFHAGHKYPLRSQTITVTRHTQKPNLIGVLEDFEYTGQELAMFLDQRERPEDLVTPSREFSFLDAKLRADPGTKVPEARRCGRSVDLPAAPIDFTLQDLVAHFAIPAVPDVATLNPAGYAHNLARLEELEAAANAL